MGAPYNPPVKGQDFKIRIGLQDMGSPGRLKTSPTLAAGDIKVDKDGAGFSTLASAPAASPAATASILISLSSNEMNADVVTLVASDQTTPPEWADLLISIPTVSA